MEGTPVDPDGTTLWKCIAMGLCETPEDWEWSGFGHYATGSEGRLEIESDFPAILGFSSGFRKQP
jgi:hypothetical protein